MVSASGDESAYVCVSLSSRAVRAGHTDRGGHRLRGVRDWSPADRSALVHLLAHRYGTRSSSEPARGREGKRAPLLILAFLFSYSVFLLRSSSHEPLLHIRITPFPKGTCYMLRFKFCLNNFKHESWKLIWDMSKTEYSWLISSWCIIISNISVFQI